MQNEKISLDLFIQNFNIANKFDGFGVGRNKAKNSFAFQTAEEAIFFGQTDKDNQIIYLCINESEKIEQIIERVIEKYNLIFVDWCRSQVISE